MSLVNYSKETEELIEKLAAIEHERWAHWQSYLHSKCRENSDGSLTIPKELVDKWNKQIETSYYELTRKEQDSDREQVMKYLEYILELKHQN